MTIFRFGLLAGLTALLLFIFQMQMDAEVVETRYALSTNYTNLDKPYVFNVPKDGQMMRFELKGRVPFQSWQSIELEVYDKDDNYLFTFYDELWSENGREDGEYWEERRSAPKYAFRMPLAGEYKAYVSSQGKNGYRYKFTFRVVPIKGDSSMLTGFMWVCIVLCFVAFAYLTEESKSSKSSFAASTSKPSIGTLVIIVMLFLVPTSWLIYKGYSTDFYFSGWPSYSKQHSHVAVDRQIEGRSFRGGSNKGGK